MIATYATRLFSNCEHWRKSPAARPLVTLLGIHFYLRYVSSRAIPSSSTDVTNPSCRLRREGQRLSRACLAGPVVCKALFGACNFQSHALPQSSVVTCLADMSRCARQPTTPACARIGPNLHWPNSRGTRCPGCSISSANSPTSVAERPFVVAASVGRRATRRSNSCCRRGGRLAGQPLPQPGDRLRHRRLHRCQLPDREPVADRFIRQPGFRGVLARLLLGITASIRAIKARSHAESGHGRWREPALGSSLVVSTRDRESQPSASRVRADTGLSRCETLQRYRPLFGSFSVCQHSRVEKRVVADEAASGILPGLEKSHAPSRPFRGRSCRSCCDCPTELRRPCPMRRRLTEHRLPKSPPRNRPHRRHRPGRRHHRHRRQMPLSGLAGAERRRNADRMGRAAMSFFVAGCALLVALLVGIILDDVDVRSWRTTRRDVTPFDVS